MAEDGKVEYLVRADISKLDGDLASAKEKIVKSADETAEKQEKAEKKTVEAVKSGESEKAKATENTGKKSVKSAEETADKQEKAAKKSVKALKNSEEEKAEAAKKAGDKISESVKKTQQETEDSASKAAKHFKKSTEEIEGAAANASASIIGKIGKVAATAMSARTAVNLLKTAISEAVSYESSYAKVKTLLSDGTDKEAYYSDIKAASKATGVDVSAMSEAVYGAISASVDESAAVDFTQSAVKLAKGGFTEAATAVDVLTTAINAYGLEASDATRISDILITTQNLGKTTVDELAASMGQTIPIANSANAAIDDLATQYAIMTKNGVATAESGTQIKAMLNELSASGTNVSKVLLEISGKSFAELQSEGKNTAEILNMLAGYAEQNNMKLSDLFGSVEAGAAALTLVKDGGEDFCKTLEQMRNSAGATEKAYATMSNTTEERFNKLRNELMITVSEVGEKLLPVIEDLFDYISDNSEEIKDLISGVGSAIAEIIKIVLEVVKAAWQFKDVLIPLAAGLGAAKLAMKAFTAACNTNPILLAASAVVALTSALIPLALRSGACSAEIERLYGETKQLRQNIDDAISSGEAECSMLRTKADRYEELRKSVERTAAEEAELKSLAADLQTALGGNVTLVNELTGEYYSAADAVDAFCAKKMQEIRLSAYEEQAKEAYKKIAEIEKKLPEAQAENERTLQELNSSIKNYENNAWVPFYGVALQYDMHEKTVASQTAMANLDALNAAKAEAQAIIDEYESLARSSYVESSAASNRPNNSSAGAKMASNGTETEAEKLARLAYGKLPDGSKPSTGGTAGNGYTAPVATVGGGNGTNSGAGTSGSGDGTQTTSATTSGKTAPSTINITSYIPTVWDDADAANKKLIAGGVAASLVGNSKSGKLITGLDTASQVSAKAEAADATLNDVVKAVNNLKKSQEDLTVTVTAILKCDSVTLAKQAIKGIKAIEKSTGKSPI